MNKNLLLGVGVTAIVLLGIFYFLGQREYLSEEKMIKIGVTVYKMEDTYISTIISELEQIAKTYEKENNVQVRLDISDANESQSVQNDQIARYLTLDYDVICVNMVDRTEAASIINKAMDKNIPLIFYNREPVAEDMQKWDQIYYVGFDAKKSAHLQAQIILDAYEENPKSIDYNGDGVIQYILFEGETRHQDSLIRTEQVIAALKNGGMHLEKLGGALANWNRNQANVLMERFLTQFEQDMELIISNNDDMALGAIEAITAEGISFNNIVGIDKTPAGEAAVDNGLMLGTVDTSARRCAEAVFKICCGLALSESIDDKVTLIDEKYIWVEQEIYTGR